MEIDLEREENTSILATNISAVQRQSRISEQFFDDKAVLE